MRNRFQKTSTPFTTIKDFDVILCDGENYTVEFKESADKSLASEVCAFANASGGRIFIGVSDDGKVIGTDISNTARSRIQDTINQIEPCLKVDIAIHGNIIVVTVPEGTSKPYSCAKGFYLRSGPNSQKLERDSIIDFLQTEGKVIYDSIVNEKYPITDNFSEVEYIKYLRKSGISDVLSREAVLKNLGCAEIASNGCLSYTNAGILFFRDNSQDVRFDFAHVACVLYKGTNKIDIIDAKTFDGGIIENIDNAVVFLKRNLRVRYEIKTVQRQNILELPEDALREAVVNAVCHRDYFEKGARVMVEIFDDRVEITNPGSLPKGVTKENFGSISVTRNPIIASLLHRARYIERMGTGINRISGMMEAVGFKKPAFQTDGPFFKVTFERELSADDTVNGTVNGVGTVNEAINGTVNSFGTVNETVNGTVNSFGTVNEVINGTVNAENDTVNNIANRNAILCILAEAPQITYAMLSERLNMPRRTLAREIKALREQGVIKRIGSTKSGHWEVNVKN